MEVIVACGSTVRQVFVERYGEIQNGDVKYIGGKDHMRHPEHTGRYATVIHLQQQLAISQQLQSYITVDSSYIHDLIEHWKSGIVQPYTNDTKHNFFRAPLSGVERVEARNAWQFAKVLRKSSRYLAASDTKKEKMARACEQSLKTDNQEIIAREARMAAYRRYGFDAATGKFHCPRRLAGRSSILESSGILDRHVNQDRIPRQIAGCVRTSSGPYKAAQHRRAYPLNSSPPPRILCRNTAGGCEKTFKSLSAVRSGRYEDISQLRQQLTVLQQLGDLVEVDLSFIHGLIEKRQDRAAKNYTEDAKHSHLRMSDCEVERAEANRSWQYAELLRKIPRYIAASDDGKKAVVEACQKSMRKANLEIVVRGKRIAVFRRDCFDPANDRYKYPHQSSGCVATLQDVWGLELHVDLGCHYVENRDEHRMHCSLPGCDKTIESPRSVNYHQKTCRPNPNPAPPIPCPNPASDRKMTFRTTPSARRHSRRFACVGNPNHQHMLDDQK
ncbi:hypothetical protein LTR86_010472 [Recurvomyces mirabilis]|nr:hypothetical protein LTR86_010472 [Recurvomyces mirabilis]